MITEIGAPLQVPANAGFQGVAPEQARRPRGLAESVSEQQGAQRTAQPFVRRKIEAHLLPAQRGCRAACPSSVPAARSSAPCHALSDGPAARRRTPRCGDPETAAALRWSAPCSCGPPSPGCRRADSSAGRSAGRRPGRRRSGESSRSSPASAPGSGVVGQRRASPRRRTCRSSRRARAPAGIRQPSSEALEHVLEADLLVRNRPASRHHARGRRAEPSAGSRARIAAPVRSAR